jgi:TonB-linked SusC/RagA family outer membrane protein
MSKIDFQKRSSRLFHRVPALLLALVLPAMVWAQNLNISGTVLDANNEPVIGASVLLKGSSVGAMTSVNGEYSIQAPANGVLVFTFMGMKKVEVPVNGRTRVDVVLQEDASEIDEVVVTAFGTGQKKETLTGAVQSIRPSDLVVPSSNLSNAFAGRLAGVIAFQRSGEPGKNGSDFYIRGISTLSGITKPLVILDGVEIEASDINDIDPEIIESFSILKDAAASAMYGTRGANGVMIVKTKSGADTERPIIGVRFETNITMPSFIPQFVDGATYMEMKNEAIVNQNSSTALYSQAAINATRDPLADHYIYPNVNWYDEAFKSMAVNEKVNFNIRGGTKKIVYFMNMTLNHETGMLKDRSQELFSYSNNIDLLRYAFQNNVDFHMTSTSTISLHLNAQISDKHSANIETATLYNDIMQTNPVDYPAMYPNTDKATGEPLDEWYYWGIFTGGNAQGVQNPLARLTNGYRDIFESRLLANVDFDQKLDFLTEGLSFKAMVSFNNWNQTETSREQPVNYYYLGDPSIKPNGNYNLTSYGTPDKPTLSTASTVDGDHRIYAQAHFNYMRTFSEMHNVGAMVLWNMDQYNYNVPGGNLIKSLPKRKMGYAARLTYDYDYRYLVEFNAGYNGSENFAAGHRWGFFPSASAGWNVAREDFWNPLKKIIPSLKIRASYGLVGNDQITDSDGNLIRFIYLSDISLTGSKSYLFGLPGGSYTSQSGPAYTRYQNNDITWEVGHKLNIGVDLNVLNVNLVFDIFQEKRDNIFQQKYSIPNYFGTAGTVIYGNFAATENSGFDISVDYGKQITPDWSVQFKATFTYAHNVVTKYDEAPGLRPALSKVGHNINTILGYQSNGLYIDAADLAHNPISQLGNIAIAAGDIKYVDQPNELGYYDGSITSDDRIPMGYPTIPEINYGFGPSIQWKNLDFSFFFQGAARTSLMMSGFQPFGTQYNRNVLQWIADDYWSSTNQNPNAAYPRITQFDNGHNTAASDYWLRDASFLKLKNLEIGYRFYKKMFRVYLSGMNLWTLSSFDLWDPEMGGGKGLSYPTQKVYNVGVQMTIK